MPERKPRRDIGRGTVALLAASLLAVFAATLHTARDGDPGAGAVTQPPVSDVASARVAPDEESVGGEPPLIEILQAADLLARAGAIEAPPSLAEVLRAADALNRAGALPPQATQPSLMEILQAADALNRAGALPPQATQPSLMEILQAADAVHRLALFAASLTAPSLMASLWVMGSPVRAGEYVHLAALVAFAPAPVLPSAETTAPIAPAPAAPVEPAPRPAPTPPPPAPAAPAPQASAPAAVVEAGDTAFEQRVFAGVNARRAGAGLGAVAAEPRLTRAARDYAQLMAAHGWFSHTGPDGSTLVERVEAAGFPFTVPLGEVLAMGSDGWPAEEIVQAWIDSPSHRAQLLEPVYTRAGIGCAFTVEGGAPVVRCVMEFAG